MTNQPLKDSLPERVAARVRSIKESAGVVTIVLDASGLAPSTRTELEQAVKQLLIARPEVKDVRVASMADKVERRIIAIGSGKGGVGKSTLTANLALALARQGRKVGLVDADVYGPSQPTLLDSKGVKPKAEGNRLIPVPGKWGVPMLSMGHLVEPGKALAWRGPMAGNAFAQLVEADWGDTELLLIDLPPGTGDVQLTMVQRFKPDGAVIVSTPQDLALIDAQRAANLFAAADIPIIGLVENMSGYACPHCGKNSNPFGAGGLSAIAENTQISFLGRIPLDIEIRRHSDSGVPVASEQGGLAEHFTGIARGIGDWLDQAGQGEHGGETDASSSSAPSSLASPLGQFQPDPSAGDQGATGNKPQGQV